ncbi:glycosyltransferase, partial [Desulfonatronospira sp. MSAO_Bac3]|uniref:glycosyltransferase n=1 Tax=Desulfonatronospira sp. MSAO_Bac3 TaxID=2293857 RepID=UPI000FF2A879
RNQVFLAYRCPDLGRRFAVPRIRLPFLNRLDPYTLHQLVSYARSQNIDTLISTNRKFYFLGALAARLSGCRHFVRCGIVWRVPDNVYYRFLFKKIDGVIVNARAVQAELIRSGPVKADRVHLIYNGLDTDRLDNIELAPVAKPFPFTVIASGELIPRKGHTFLLRAFARFVKAFPGADAGLVIIGKGKQEHDLKLLTKKFNLEKYVLFTGFLDNPYPLMRQGDIFVSVSRNEGLSNSMLEAMYLGLPVIATPAGGAAEVIKHGKNGFLVEHGDESNLADLFIGLFMDQEHLLPEIARNGQQTVANRFSVRDMALAIEKAFES